MKHVLMISIFLLCSLDCFADKNFGVGAGWGVHYGFSPGVNVRYRVNKLEPYGALGLGDHYAVGALYHVFDRDGFWQPRLGINYGTNGDLRVLNNNDELKDGGYDEIYWGWTATVGIEIAFGRNRMHGLEFDVGYKLTDGGFREADERFQNENPSGPHGRCGMNGMGCVLGLFMGSYDLQLSVGWQLKF